MNLLLIAFLVGKFGSDESYSPPHTLLEIYESGVYENSNGQEQVEVPYRLHVPPQLETGRSYPMLIWLHGYGEQGTDNKQQLRWLDLVASTLPDEDYYCLAVQCPEGQPWFRSVGTTPDNYGSLTMEIFAELSASHPIDNDRVYLAGVSSGATGCWEMATRYPERFAAILSMSSSSGIRDGNQHLTQIPIWAFYSVTDPTPPPLLVQAVNALKQLGGNVQLTMVDNRELFLNLELSRGLLVDHDTWTAAFEHYKALEWLFSQRRGKAAIFPDPQQWAWWTYALVAGIPLGVVIVWVWNRRQPERSGGEPLNTRISSMVD